MLMFAAGPGDLWADGERTGMLASFCARLIQERSLSGCLAPLPDDHAQRIRLFAFLNSLKRAGGGDAGVVISAARITVADLDACRLANVDRVVIWYGPEANGHAMATVSEYLDSAVPNAHLGIQVWIAEAHAGQVHRVAAKWSRAFENRISVELAPVVLASSRGRSFESADATSADWAVVSQGSDALPLSSHVACEWLRSAVTVHPSGAVVPCPDHEPSDALGLDRRPDELLHAIASFPTTLASNPTCRGCTRRMRFTIPDWMKSGYEVASDPPERESVPELIDHVEGRLDDVAAEARGGIIDAFIARARRAGAPVA